MTAEVAIINRVGVALAADSAMTLSGGMTHDKIYNTADKIFELSPHDPIGLMIFNNLDFMGFPLDVAIKMFRDSAKCKACRNMDEMASNFFDYLVKDIGADQEAQNRHVRNIAIGLLGYVRNEFDIAIERAIAEHGEKGIVKRFDAHKPFLDVVNRTIRDFKGLPIAAGFEELSVAKLSDLYGAAIGDAVKVSMDGLPLGDGDRHLLRELVATFVQRDAFSSSHTGFVFAGYTGNDPFPSLVSYEVDGIVGSQVKKRKTRSATIDRTAETADIIPFAQHDMADRFLFGIDPEFESGIPNFLEHAMRSMGKALIKESVGRSKKKAKLLESKLDQAVKITLSEFKDGVTGSIKEAFKRQIQGMVSFMPKKEMADFAESLVDITSIKRRVSAEQETVGGPIDVAVISRSDGFVWVHRKHYFDGELNPRFFNRKFGPLVSGLNGRET